MHWAFLLVFMPPRVTKFQDKLAHLVSNMWMVHPARTTYNHMDQVHKSREQTLALTCALINTTVASIIAATLMEGEGQLTSLGLSASFEYLVVGGCPAILSHLLGCLFLALYYSCSHTWREMGQERETGRWGFFSRICNQLDPVVAEEGLASTSSSAELSSRFWTQKVKFLPNNPSGKQVASVLPISF